MRIFTEWVFRCINQSTKRIAHITAWGETLDQARKQIEQDMWIILDWQKTGYTERVS